MGFEMVPSIVECPLHFVPQAFGSSLSSSLFTSSYSTTNRTRNQKLSRIVLSNPFSSQTFNKTLSRGHTIKRSCCSNLGDVFYEEPSNHVEGLTDRFSLLEGEENEGDMSNRLHCEISETSPSTSKYAMNKNSFLPSNFEFLEPMKLGIRPDALDWPERETVMWATLEQKAKSFDLPLSLRMLKKKLQLEEVFTHSEDSVCCSVKKAFASMVFIVVELQSYALQMREALCHEDLEIIIAKVQKEMHSSFVWLFQHVFSRTPALMIYLMILLANFSVYSACHNVSIAEASLLGSSSIESTSVSEIGASGGDYVLDEGSVVGNEQKTNPSKTSPEVLQEELLQVGDQDLRSVEEWNLWNSVVEEATKIEAGLRNVNLDHDVMQQFVTPVSVELEPDDYEDYLRTDLLYQIALSQEPNNPLLLCNYAQFLHLVTRDYDRAEQCFKLAVQAEPPDAESLSQYATFLWKVRQDFWAAEERYLQALAVEPDNSHYASKYANFLWNTGGEETCFPLDNSHPSSSTSNF
ncbi:Tetratricopeptide repeat (TPR)-like superfamily protein [Abeliophyllum distichum]|uniref:Tetratricopeptide repeat (TPR)-like superfamily protein n=1 Tax=Abeliophyllum distichum TaxID=126358 RepID=A0ABD1VR93_9LAMI